MDAETDVLVPKPEGFCRSPGQFLWKPIAVHRKGSFFRRLAKPTAGKSTDPESRLGKFRDHQRFQWKLLDKEIRVQNQEILAQKAGSR